MKLHPDQIEAMRASHRPLRLARPNTTMLPGIDHIHHIHHILDESTPNPARPLCGADTKLARGTFSFDAEQHRLCPICWDAFETPALTFPDIQAFYTANEQRRKSPEAGYGVRWVETLPHEQWRVAYVKHTGEVYACRTQAGQLVQVLGTVPPDHVDEGDYRRCWYHSLEQLLEGYSSHCGKPSGLSWLKHRLTEVQAD